jgi:hypothetical protein
MIKPAESTERSVISDVVETPVFETAPSREVREASELISKTTVGEETFCITGESAIRKNLSTLADPSKREFSELSPDNIRKINRLITRNISPGEKEAIINERNQLIQKQFKGGLSPKEERRLTYVRWQLDRIDDAESGEFLDYLEQITESHEKFSKELKGLLNQMESVQSRPKRRKKK